MLIMLHPPAKFRSNRKKTSADFCRHIDFSRWRSWSRKSTSEFRFSDAFVQNGKNLCAYQISM